MATPDLRFFATPHGRRLPDGQPRRGISVVAALSRWLTHTNRRPDGAWTQRYEHGVPTADLIPIPPSRTPGTGTTVRFDADPALVPDRKITPDRMRHTAASFAWLTTDVTAEQRPAADS